MNNMKWLDRVSRRRNSHCHCHPVSSLALTLRTAHEHQLVAPTAPRPLHVASLLRMVRRTGHHPAQHAHIVEQLIGQRRVLQRMRLVVCAVHADVLLRAGLVAQIVGGVRVVHLRPVRWPVVWQCAGAADKDDGQREADQHAEDEGQQGATTGQGAGACGG